MFLMGLSCDLLGVGDTKITTLGPLSFTGALSENLRSIPASGTVAADTML